MTMKKKTNKTDNKKTRNRKDGSGKLAGDMGAVKTEN